MSPEPARFCIPVRRDRAHVLPFWELFIFFDHMRNMEDYPFWSMGSCQFKDSATGEFSICPFQSWSMGGCQFKERESIQSPPLEGIPSVHFRSEVWEAASLRISPLESFPSVHSRVGTWMFFSHRKSSLLRNACSYLGILKQKKRFGMTGIRTLDLEL